MNLFIPRRHTEGGPIVFTYVLFCVRKRILDFQFVTEKTPFWNLQMFYCDGTGRTDGRDGRTGRMDGRVNKSFLQFSSYFVGI